VPIALPLIDEPVVDLFQLQASLFHKLGFIIFLYQQNPFHSTIIEFFMDKYAYNLINKIKGTSYN
jgi:hypothetical protein